MSEAFFYQVTEQNRIATLRTMLARCRDEGWRVAVRCASDNQARMIDDSLWQAPGDSFLPHARAGGEFDEEQPILITVARAAANRSDALILFGHSAVGLDELSAFRRISVLFNGDDQDELASARQLWKQFTGCNLPMKYWARENGKWSLKAQANYPGDAG